MTVVPHPVYLVRHGQSEWNVLRLTQGQTPHPSLTMLGRAQAASAARLIAADLATAGQAVRRIVTSDLVRAAETAEILGESLGAPVSLDVRLREQDLGDLEGRGYEETWAAAEEIDWSDPTVPIAGGESLMDVYDRMAAALADIPPAEVTVLVSHGDAIRAAIALLKGLKPHESEWVEVPNGAVTRIDGEVAWLGQ
jgi:probable phosphoglycerate mutase